MYVNVIIILLFACVISLQKGLYLWYKYTVILVRLIKPHTACTTGQCYN